MADNHDTDADRMIAEDGLAIIESMIESAMALQEEVKGMALWRIDFFLPLPEESSEEQASLEHDKPWDSIVDNSVTVGPVNIYSMSESLDAAFSDFIGQTFSVASAYSQHAAPDRAVVPPSAMLRQTFSSKELTNSSKDNSSRDIGERTIALQATTLQPIGESTISESSKLVEDSLKASSSAIEELKSASDIISAVRLDESGSNIVESFQEAIRSSGEKTLDVMSVRQLDMHTIDIPAISPGRKPVIVSGGSSGASLSMTSREREATLEQEKFMASSSTYGGHSSALSSVYDAIAEYSSASFAVNTIEPLLAAAARPASPDTAVSPLSMLLSIPGGTATSPGAGFSLTQAVYELFKETSAVNAIAGASPAISMANNVTLFSENNASYPAASHVQRIIENTKSAMSVVPARVESQKSAGASFHNTFNITVNMKGREDEAEMRELGRKIGLILTEELKRYGGS